ncbi:MAG: EAL domain-containing protein, partial [Burkholderiaceae bacterium]
MHLFDQLLKPSQPGKIDSRRARRIAIGLACLAILATVIAALQAGIYGAVLVAAISMCCVLLAALTMRNAQLRDHHQHVNALQRLRAQHETGEKMAALGLWGLNLQRRTLSFSPGAFRVFALDPAAGEPALDDFVDCIHTDDRKRWTDVHRRAIRRKSEVKVEYRFIDHNGTERWMRSVARPVQNAGGKTIRVEGTVQDISGMRAMQRQLAASEAKFRDLTLLSSDWVWESDTQDRITYVSDSVDAVLGKWARNIVGRRRWDNDLPDALPTDWSYLKTALAEHRPFEGFEYTRVDDEGNLHHLSISGRPVFDERNAFAGYRGTGHNITREKQQRMLLELDGDIAAIMREQTDPDKVITAIIITVCGKLGWLGGLRLVRHDNRSTVHERWGYPEFTRMVLNLPRTMPVNDKSIETRVWETGKALWIRQARRERDFAKRYGLKELGAEAAFVAPITDENGDASSTLLFLARVGFKGDQFLGEIAAVLSRSLSLYLQRTSAEAQLRHASQHDALTGLPNRIYIGEQLDSLLRQKQSLAVCYIDLDRYKIINDTLGHSTGDKALIEVARRIADALPEGDTAGRLGGDEFVAIIKNPDGRSEVESIARKILTAIEKPLILAERAYFLSASIGVAMAPDDSNEGAQLIKAADAAMYQVKTEGRNDVRFFSGDLRDAERSEQLQLAAEMPMAMQRNEVELFYQPVLDVSQRKVLSIEGLLRWRHPSLGLLRPERFLPVAEQSNLIREIGFWAIRRAIEDRTRLGLDRYDDLAVSVNISVRQLAEDGFVENIFNLIEEKDFPPQLLRLELTESSFIENPERTVSLISELRRLGIKVIIDNFGTGYASLSYIKNLPVDGLKIDR